MAYSKALQNLQRVRRLRSCGVVRIEIRCPDHAIGADHKPRRDRQFPFVVSVELIKIDAELAVDLFQVVGKAMLEPQLVCIGVIGVMQDFEIQFS